jgi:hypothetical protein
MQPVTESAVLPSEIEELGRILDRWRRNSHPDHTVMDTVKLSLGSVPELSLDAIRAEDSAHGFAKPALAKRIGQRAARFDHKGNRRRGRAGSPGFELLFCIQRQLDHALEQLIGWQSREVLEHELFDVESHQVA